MTSAGFLILALLPLLRLAFWLVVLVAFIAMCKLPSCEKAKRRAEGGGMSHA